MHTSIEVIEPKLFAGVVADEIVASVSDSVSEIGSCSLVLAGGTTPGAIYRSLTHPPRVSEMPWASLRIYLSDERWVDHKDNLSNFKMIQETLVHHLSPPHPKVFAVDTALPNVEQGATAYEKVIRSNENSDAKGYPILDLVLLGVGSDGHTASIFPGDDWRSRKGRVCYGVNHPELGLRVTLSPEVLLAARKILMIVTGTGKADVMKGIFEGNEGPDSIPAALFKGKESVTWFLDSEAAARLTK